jgi:hypothetical protein
LFYRLNLDKVPIVIIELTWLLASENELRAPKRFMLYLDKLSDLVSNSKCIKISPPKPKIDPTLYNIYPTCFFCDIWSYFFLDKDDNDKSP